MTRAISRSSCGHVADHPELEVAVDELGRDARLDRLRRTCTRTRG